MNESTPKPENATENSQNTDIKDKNNNENNSESDPYTIRSSLEVMIENKNADEINYNAMINNAKLKSVLALIYFIFVIVLETTYRDSLFKESIEIEEELEKGHDKDSFYFTFWKFLSEFGTAKITLTYFGIIFLFFPLNSSFLFMQIISYTSFTTNLLKMLYKQHRPFWHSENLFIACNSGYGNPSGHSCTSTGLYLTLAHILTNFDFFKSNQSGNTAFLLKIGIYAFLILLAILIMFSRIVLGAHSINQVIFGFTLGFGIYFIVIHVLGYHKMHPNIFIKHFRHKITKLAYLIFHSTLILISTIVYLSINDDSIIEIRKKIFNGVRCKAKNEYLLFKNDGYYQTLSICGLIGLQLGLNMLFDKLESKHYFIDENVLNWNKTAFPLFIKRLPIILASLIGICLYLFVPGSWNVWIVFLFKSGISFFLALFGLSFIGLYLCITWSLSNPLINLNKKDIDMLDKL